MVTFGLLGLFLALTTLLQIRFGLAPLAKLRTALGAIRRGEADRIGGEYPRDIAPLAGEVNLLIETNREILRARATRSVRSGRRGTMRKRRGRWAFACSTASPLAPCTRAMRTGWAVSR